MWFSVFDNSCSRISYRLSGKIEFDIIGSIEKSLNILDFFDSKKWYFRNLLSVSCVNRVVYSIDNLRF